MVFSPMPTGVGLSPLSILQAPELAFDKQKKPKPQSQAGKTRNKGQTKPKRKKKSGGGVEEGEGSAEEIPPHTETQQIGRLARSLSQEGARLVSTLHSPGQQRREPTRSMAESAIFFSFSLFSCQMPDLGEGGQAEGLG